MSERNWAGNITYRAAEIHRPASVDALRELIAGAPQINVLGSRHSFNAIADGAALVTLDALPQSIEIDADANTVSCSGAITYGALANALNAAGYALANLASLPHISLAGSIATATHGSGDRNGNLATAVAALELVDSAGELHTLTRASPDFDGHVVALGALGAVTTVTLEIEPTYAVTQHAYTALPWSALTDHFDAVTSAGYSVSVFSRWGDDAGHVVVKQRAGAPAAPDELFGARAASENVHPIPTGDLAAVTPQLGESGPWHERLPHFRMQFTPSAGEELQSEYLIDRRDAPAAIAALRPLAARIAPILHITEIRTIAADRLWLSPSYERDSVGIHFTWQRQPDAVAALLPEIEAVLAQFEPRPHWGKLFVAEADVIGARYPRAAEFVALAERLDPRGAFRNAWLERHLFGG